MSNINVRSGILLVKNDKYSVYQMEMMDDYGEFSEYYMGIPNDNMNNYQIVLDFPEVSFDVLDRNNQINEIKKVTDILYNHKDYGNSIYVLPKIDPYIKKDAIKYNENRFFNKLYNKVMPFVSHAYWSVMDKNDGIISVNNSVNIVIQTEEDKNFLRWLYVNNGINVHGFFAPINLMVDNTLDDAGSFATLSGTSNADALTDDKPKARKLAPPKNSHGYTNIWFMILLLAITLGVIVGYFALKL